MFNFRHPDQEEIKYLKRIIELLEEELEYEERRRILAELQLELAVEYQDYFKGVSNNV